MTETYVVQYSRLKHCFEGGKVEILEGVCNYSKNCTIEFCPLRVITRDPFSIPIFEQENSDSDLSAKHL